MQESINIIKYLKGSNKKVHMIGIAGSSMSGLAIFLSNKGIEVSGSDIMEGANVDYLRQHGISVIIGHDKKNLNGKDLVIYTKAIMPDNVELMEAKDKGIPIMERAELLGEISKEFKTSIAVCGTHGKTTTTSMLSQILIEAGIDPTVHIGGMLKYMGGSVRVGASDVFVTEACEYKRSFMSLEPSLILLLNIDNDHLDYFKDINDIRNAFCDFVKKLPDDGLVIGNDDDQNIKGVLSEAKKPFMTFGEAKSADYSMQNVFEDKNGYVAFYVYNKNTCLGNIKMQVPGIFNAKNALAAFAVAHSMGVNKDEIIKSLEEFTGANRRFELTGEINGIEFFTDYGHNPAEIKNAMSVARKRCTRGKLFAVLQPHTYSRVKKLYDDYLNCTKLADYTLVSDISGAREKDPGDINSKMLVDDMKKAGMNAYYTPEFVDVIRFIKDNARDNDLVITLGCGNIYKVNEMINKEMGVEF